jgi:UDP-galactopyranose mutase
LHHLRGKSLTNEANTSLCYQSRIIPEDEPYYPVNDDKNGKLYAEYKKLADNEKNIIFGGVLENISIMIWMLLLRLHLICVRKTLI